MAACPDCGKDNPAGFRFCGHCGGSLPEATQKSAEERKVVTVLFCDVVGFTSTSERADPEDVRARMQPYYARLRQEIEAFGGTVEKFIGDAVMAIFGAPVAHEDDAERAVRAGLRILEAIEELNGENPSLGLSVRIGVNTGEVVVNLGASLEAGEAAVLGDAVNTASRIQAVAPVNGVAVGEGTFRATERVFDYERVRPVSAKGKTEPVAIWQALSARARFGTDMRTHETPLVGRQVERDLLRGLFERAVRDTSVQLVTIVGEPGVGKSRLVWELQRFVDDSPDLVAWRQGRCLPYGAGIAFWALGEIIKADAGILESDSPDVVAEKLGRTVQPSEPDREWLLRRVGTLVGVEADVRADQEESFTAWRRFLEGIADQRPAVFVFEDVHWAEPALLDFLRHVAEWSEAVAMVIVCTGRPELLDRYPEWAGGMRNATTINLSPLTQGETGELIGALLKRSLLPAEVQQPIVDRSGGNPLYAEEYVRMLRDRGILVEQGRTWSLAPGAVPPLPENVQALVAARLDTLSPERKMVLQDAAILGKVFWAAAVAALGRRDESAVREALHELSRRDLVRSSRASSMEGEAEYAFTHLVIRDVAYGQIPRAAKVAKHRAAAAWIDEKAGDRAEDLAEVLAYHVTEALDLARSAGLSLETAELQDAARRYLVMAGERASRLDIGRARELFARALELTPSDNDGRRAILERYAEAAKWTSKPDIARDALVEAVELSRKSRDTRAEGHARLLLARVLAEFGARVSEDELIKALQLLERLGPSIELRDGYATMASFRYVEGQEREAIEWADRAIALEREFGLERSGRALAVRGGSRATLGERAGLDDVRRAIELIRLRDDTWEVVRSLSNLALDLHAHEGPAASLRVAEEGRELAERRGISAGARRTFGAMLDAWTALGRWDDVERQAEAVLGGEEEPSEMESFFIGASLVEIRAHRGHAASLVQTAERQLAFARDDRERQCLVTALAVGALVSTLTRHEPSARSRLTELATSEECRRSWNFAIFLPTAVRSAARLGDANLAQLLVGDLDALTWLHRNVLLGARAAIAELRREYEPAVNVYSQAVEEWRSFGNVPETAFSELGRGRCLLALGRGEEASEALDSAQCIFARLRATPYLAEIRDLLTPTAKLTSDVG